jgi:hypothetical protein
VTFVREGRDRPGGVEPSLPERLIDEQVAEARDDPLVHERSFHRPPPPGEDSQDLVLRDGEGVRPESSEDGAPLVGVVRQPDAVELPHVAEPECAVVELENNPVVPMLLPRADVARRSAVHAARARDPRGVVFRNTPRSSTRTPSTRFPSAGLSKVCLNPSTSGSSGTARAFPAHPRIMRASRWSEERDRS